MVHIIGNQNNLIKHFCAELRDVDIQKDSMRFRRNLERIGEVLAYELSKTLSYADLDVTTPLGVKKTHQIKTPILLAAILRAALPVHQGLLNYFDKAENAFISAYRRHHKDNTFDIHIEYLSSPDIDGKTLILCDPMLATGSSMVLSYQAMLKKGTPSSVHIVSAIASKQGIDYVKQNMPVGTNIWIAEMDEELTSHAYIVPGLGDAGDLAYGVKI
jgi:uracil phosphoribosyltransferase